MKYLLIILALVFASCSSTHKIKETKHSNIDSTTTTVKDSTKVSTEKTQADNFVAKGVDIQFDYGNEDTSQSNVTTITPAQDSPVKWTPFYYNPKKPGSSAVDKVVNQAISNSGLNGRIPVSIKIHIDSLGNSSVVTAKTDSANNKDSGTNHTKAIVNESKKDKTTKGLGFGVYAIVGLIVLGGLFAGARKLKLV